MRCTRGEPNVRRSMESAGVGLVAMHVGRTERETYNAMGDGNTKVVGEESAERKRGGRKVLLLDNARNSRLNCVHGLARA